MDLSIIIVNYKSKEKTRTCLQSLALEDLGGLSYEIIIVENNSGDDLSDLVLDQANIRLILAKRNRGMGAGNNLGLREAQGEFILILNPDTIIHRGAIKAMLNYLQGQTNVGLVGPKLLNSDGSLQLSCARFPSFFVPVLRRTFLGDYFKSIRDKFTMSDFDHKQIREVDWLMGSCLLFKRSYQLADGTNYRPSFDERYFMYFEDVDLARTFKAKQLSTVYNPEAIVTHDHARESAKYPWYQAIFKDKLTWIHIRSWFKYFIKWGFKN